MVYQLTGLSVSDIHHVDVGTTSMIGEIGEKASIRGPGVRGFIRVIGFEFLKILFCAIYQIKIRFSFVLGSKRQGSGCSGL